MSDIKSREDWEEQVRSLARLQDYPVTPDIANQVTEQLAGGRNFRLMHSLRFLPLVMALALLLLLVPPVRATVLEVIQVGAIRLLSGPMDSVPATPIPLLQGLSGHTSLEAARASVQFNITIPTNWPEPEYVFHQEIEGVPTVILVWLEDQDEDHLTLSLHLIGSSQVPLIEKMDLEYLEQTRVNGKPAVWIEGPHIYRQASGGTSFMRLIEGNVLLWTSNGVTYRLETALSRSEAISIAESLK